MQVGLIKVQEIHVQVGLILVQEIHVQVGLILVQKIHVRVGLMLVQEILNQRLLNISLLFFRIILLVLSRQVFSPLLQV